MKITEDRLFAACKAFSESDAVYPDGSAATQITDWFRLDAQDAVDFCVLAEPKWDGVSDIRGTQHEWYVASVIKEPMRAALTAALAVQTQQGVEVKATEINDLIEELLDAQQDINLAANSHMDQSLCDASALIDRVEAFLRRVSALVDVPAAESEPAALIEREVLAELAKHKTATGTVCSPLFKSKFGDKVPLFSRPPRSPSNEGWMSIETAPKTGEAILVVGPDKKGGQYFDVQRWPEGWSGEWPVSYMAYAAGGPTHWMHLPTPPLSTRKGSAGDGSATGTKDADHG